MIGRVVSVARSGAHEFTKTTQESIVLVQGKGVADDVHMGETVKHRSRVAVDPSQPNLRQVHLIQAELFEELEVAGFRVGPGLLGENITTRGVDILALPVHTRLHIQDAVIELTGLRNPCAQIETFMSGLLSQLLVREPDGNILRKAGVMAIVVAGGTIQPEDVINVELPQSPFKRLERV